MMTREEAITILQEKYDYCKSFYDLAAYLEMAKYLQALQIALSALRPVSRERVEKFKEYFDGLYGKGLEVYGWHMNGEAKPFDDFYEDAFEYAGL